MEKKMVSGRVPLYVVNFAKNHNLSISDLIMQGFDTYRENDEHHANERYNYHESRLLHWKQKLIHIDEERNKKIQLCNTVKEVFIENKRHIRCTKYQNLIWLEPKVKELINQGVLVTTDELLKICMKEVE